VSPVLMSRYNRETLYERVWTVTLRDLAKEYGVSDVAMGICGNFVDYFRFARNPTRTRPTWSPRL
jgi:hypothetical protein